MSPDVWELRDFLPRLDLGFDFWFAEVPDAGDDHEGVFALYRIHETERSVTCDVIATLRKPVVP